MHSMAEIRSVIGESNRKGWQDLWHSIVVEDARCGGISFDKIFYDERAEVPDGGIDIRVHVGTTRDGARFIKTHPSIWSIKSGADGLKPATLRKELDETKHKPLVDALRGGSQYFYCNCHAASQTEQAALKTTAAELTKSLGLNEDRIVLYFDQHLRTALEIYQGILVKHCPDLARDLGVGIDSWSHMCPNFDVTVDFVDFGGRSTIVQALVDHLEGNGDSGIMHVAGLSGIGKTRLVYEACKEERFRDVMYYKGQEQAFGLLKKLRQSADLQLRMVIDELSPDQYDEARRLVKGFENQARVITIGPASMDDRPGARPGVYIVPSPESERDILLVLRSHARNRLSEEGLAHIANQSSRDLRLALMILDSVLQDPSLLREPQRLVAELNDANAIFRRILTLFRHVDVDTDVFRARYPWLTLGLHVGVAENRRNELECVAKWAGVPDAHFEDTIEKSRRCGLGEQTAHLFEAVPRGIATRLFSDILWPRLKSTIESKLAKMPHGLLLGFRERAALCPEPVRKEVVSSLDRHFWNSLGRPLLSSLDTKDKVRAMRAWAEISPESGLDWLRQAIDASSVEELKTWPGRGDARLTPTDARRQVVWLLDHLSCFDEHYRICEAMLFRLALAENESIGNNATAQWKERLAIVLSNAEAPYPERVRTLSKRVREATEETIALVMAGVATALTVPHVVALPPPVVGGRFVPAEWRAPRRDWHTLLVDATRSFLVALRTLAPRTQSTARDLIVGRLSAFVREEVVEDVIAFLEPLAGTDEGRLRLRAAVEHLRALLRRGNNDDPDPLEARLEAWISALSPCSFKERVRDLVAKTLHEWTILDPADSPDHERWRIPHEQIARELHSDSAVLANLVDVLDQSDGNGVGGFGWMVGHLDVAASFADVVARWLREKKCTAWCSNYLVARFGIKNDLPVWAVDAIESHLTNDPVHVARLTGMCEASERGWLRIKQCAELSPQSIDQIFAPLWQATWDSIINATRLAEVLERLWQRSGTGDSERVATAINLLGFYLHRLKEAPLPQELVPIARRMSFDAAAWNHTNDAYHWGHLVDQFMQIEPDETIRELTLFATDFPSASLMLKSESLRVLLRYAERHGAAITKALLDRVMGCDYFMPFESESWQELLTKLPLETIQARLAADDLALARRLGQCMPDPEVSEDGKAVVPPLTLWYLTKFGDDADCFSKFCIGRWSGRVRTGWPWERQGEIDRLRKAYENHELPALRRWVADACEMHEQDVKRTRVHYDEVQHRS